MRRVVMIALALVACGTAGATGTTGLRGEVTRGPILPVCVAGKPCSAPAVHVALVFRRRGRVVRTTTDAKGRYRVALAAGVWTISLARTGVGSRIAPRQTHVVAGRLRTLDLSIDTGIR